MLSEYFIGKKPSHFHANAIVKAFIISELFLWTAWNFFTPIFAVFTTNYVKGGNVELAASAFSVFLITRVLCELISGKKFAHATDRQKFLVTIGGLWILSLAYVGFAFSTTILYLFIFYIIAGIGFGIATPARLSLFSTHLDKNKETVEWSIHDAVIFIGMAMAASLGGFIAHSYGFKFLFLLSAAVNLLAMIPYILYMRHRANTKSL